MKIFTAAQIRALDAFTIQEQNITSLELMERAAKACFQWITSHYPVQKPMLVLCGMGNNGGDGLALCRILIQHGYSAKAVILKHRETFSDDASHNLTALHHLAPDNIQILESGSFVSGIDENILVIDALFGTGLNRALDEWTAEFVHEINELPNEIISIDIASGLPSDVLPTKDAAVIQANHTLSFQLYKRSFLHPESSKFTGKIHLLNINLNEKFIEATHSQYKIIDKDIAKEIYKPRNSFGHKGTFGRAQVVGGSYGKIGAITLAGRACARAGAGLVFTLAPSCGNNIIQTANPESMFIASGEKIIDDIKVEEHINAIGIGPGLGTESSTKKALLQFIETNEKPLVIDADALNILSENEEHLLKLRHAAILTPHPKEFERLFGTAVDTMFQVEIGRAKAMKYNIHIILKGHHTAVLTPSGECWYNMTGNAGMATGGSGDVLTGILTALLAQGYTTKDACLLGVYLHGLAGDLAAKELSEESLIAGDIIDYLGKAFLTFRD
jgi:hydroxyethylthiazole kinase-like uncharacterized protein yjeF